MFGTKMLNSKRFEFLTLRQIFCVYFQQPLPTIRWIRQRSDEIRLALHDASRRSEVKSVSELSKIVLSRSRLVPLVQSTEGEGIIENCFVRMVLGHDSTGQTKYGVTF